MSTENKLKIARVIKGSKLILQFGTGKTLVYSDKDILVFKGFTYFKITDVWIEPNEESYLKHFRVRISK